MQFRRSRPVSAVAYCLCGLLSFSNVHAAISSTAYDAAIVAARNGQLAATIAQLRKWLAEEPGNKKIAYDLAALLDQSSDYKAVLSYYDQVVQPDAPLYALKATAHAARMTGDWPKAQAVYQQILRQSPDDADALAGEAYVLMGQNRTNDALNYVTAHPPANGKPYVKRDAPLLVARAEIYERRVEWIDAALAYQAVLAVEPTFRYALRGRVFSLQNAGLARLAEQEAARTPEVFDPAERLALAQAAGAFAIRYGEIQLATDDTANRFSTTDNALAENRKITEQFGSFNSTQFDRLVALRDRQQMTEAVTLYESMRAAGVQVPTYALTAAADAYLFLKRPEIARDIYIDALKNSAGADGQSLFEWKISLMYAYSESEQHRLAAKLAQKTLDETPKVLLKAIPNLESPAPDRTRIATVSALLDVYNDRLNDAERKLAVLRAQTPFNSEIRLPSASLQVAREHPRAALREFQSASVDFPDSIDAAVGVGEVTLSMNEFAAAKSIFSQQIVKQPDSIAVKNFEKQLRIYDEPVYRVDGRFGRGQSAAGEESITDASLYSAPLTHSLGDHYRVFSHIIQVNGKAAQESVNRTRLGAGIDYRASGIEAEAEVNQSSDHGKTAGLGLKMTLDLSDQWHVSAAAETNVVDLPAAAIRDHLTADALKLAFSWTWNESRRANIELSTLRFSDGNTRQAVQLGWRERLWSEAVFKLETGLTISASTNSLLNRAYFNPVSDHEVVADATAEWTTWRRYQRSFRQRLSVAAGNYCQSGFNCGGTADLHVEHEWSSDDLVRLRYGIGRSFHPYDGKRDFQNYLFFTLSGRIQ